MNMKRSRGPLLCKLLLASRQWSSSSTVSTKIRRKSTGMICVSAWGRRPTIVLNTCSMACWAPSEVGDASVPKAKQWRTRYRDRRRWSRKFGSTPSPCSNYRRDIFYFFSFWINSESDHMSLIHRWVHSMNVTMRLCRFHKWPMWPEPEKNLRLTAVLPMRLPAPFTAVNR